MTPIRVPLSAQIAEAERARDDALAASKTKPEIIPRLHAREAMILTLRAYQAFEEEIRKGQDDEQGSV